MPDHLIAHDLIAHELQQIINVIAMKSCDKRGGQGSPVIVIRYLEAI
jgi:hypothetical protein